MKKLDNYFSQDILEKLQIINLKNIFQLDFILFSNNLVNHTETELIEELNQIQNLSKIPLVFGVDEEGGTVDQKNFLHHQNHLSKVESVKYYL